ncbi:hypothetical protein FB451DRAFT_1183926 [Mycena latifolia]|nr:hypothetical protein FB451DRAFT_1183926 [Mycena latifolia]
MPQLPVLVHQYDTRGELCLNFGVGAARSALQLAAAADGSTFLPRAPLGFTPPDTSLACNTLWFISVGLGLSCALIATLLEQWACDFLHRADMLSAPVIRARIFSYLYYGLKRFNMHTVVEIIKLLLHASLIFFFSRLIAFLIPVNIAIAGVAASHAASPESLEIGIDEVQAAVSRVSSLPAPLWAPGPSMVEYDAVLELLINARSASPYLTVSAIAMVKSRTLDSLLGFPQRSSLTHRWLPTETALAIPAEFLESRERNSRSLSPILEPCHKSLTQSGHRGKNCPPVRVPRSLQFLFHPYRALETVHHIGVGAVHNPQHAPDLPRITCGIFDLYAEGSYTGDTPIGYPPPPNRHAWLDNATAGAQIPDTVSRHLKATPKASARAEGILRGLERLHPGTID